MPRAATKDSTQQVHLRVTPTRGAVRSVLGASNGLRQKESDAALRLVRCTIDPADAEEETMHVYRNPR